MPQHFSPPLQSLHLLSLHAAPHLQSAQPFLQQLAFDFALVAQAPPLHFEPQVQFLQPLFLHAALEQAAGFALVLVPWANPRLETASTRAMVPSLIVFNICE